MLKLTEQLDHELNLVEPFHAVWVAFSGGLDSTVLLHAAKHSHYLKMAGKLIQAVHVHHGLSPHADQWSVHCQNLCQSLQIPFIEKKVDDRPLAGESIEAWARSRRYQLLSSCLADNDLLLFAHHQDDQAETVLLKLLRGAGPHGLSGMAKERALGHGRIFRPFLSQPRARLIDYANANNLNWIEDESNNNPRFDRNYLRLEVMPKLTQRWPSMTQVIGRAADNCRDAQLLIERYGGQLFQQVFESDEQIAISPLLTMPVEEKLAVLRYWLGRFGINPERTQILQIIEDVMLAKNDAEPCYILDRFEIRRYLGHLYCLSKLPEIDREFAIKWDGNSPLCLPGFSEPLRREKLALAGLAVDHLDWGKVVVKFRQGAERCKPRGRKHSQTLKKLFQEYQIAPWRRDRMPLIYCNDKLVMVVGGWVCD